MELKNEIQEEDKSCENKYEARVIKIKFTHLLIAIILAIVIIGIVLYININIKSSISSIESDTNNSNDNISNEIEENSEQDKMYITQESSVSPSGKEFIGVFSDNLKEVYEGGTSNSKNFEFITYNTTNENIKQYSRLTKIKNNVTGNYDIVEKSSYYYNDLNKKIIASERIINDVTNYSIALQNKNTTYQEYIYNFFNSSVNIFQDLHNNNEEDNIARANKYYEYSDNVTNTVGNRGGNFNYENRTFDYEIMAYDVLYAYVTYPTNSNKEEILLLAYDENTEPEEVIKKWYQNVSTIETTNTSTSNLLEQIYAKYPEYEGKERFICTNGEEYWLLDELGKKIYFSDMESFESALLQACTSDNIDTNSNTTTNISQSSNGQLSEAKLKYNQIKEGMNYYEVISILGKPTSTNNTSMVRNCIWAFQPEIIVIQFMNNCVYQKTFNENKSTSRELDPETTHFISFIEGFELQEYTEKLDSWGIKYEVIKQENYNYNNNVVTNIEPNDCKIDKNTIVTFTVSDNTYDMDVLVDTQYLLKLAGLDISEYNSGYNYELGKDVRDNVKLTLKINGNIIFDGQTELLGIGSASPLGKVKGKPTDTYKIEVSIENVQVTKEINYNIRCNKDTQRFEIYEGGDIGAG